MERTSSLSITIHFFSNSVVNAGEKFPDQGEDRGLFLAPVDEKGEVSDEESNWINCTNLVRQNTPKKIDFYLPSQVTDGSSYRIVVKSNYINGSTKRKKPVYTYSDIVTVTAAYNYSPQIQKNCCFPESAGYIS